MTSLNIGQPKVGHSGPPIGLEATFPGLQWFAVPQSPSWEGLYATQGKETNFPKQSEPQKPSPAPTTGEPKH